MKLTVKQLKNLVRETIEQDNSANEWVSSFKEAMFEWTGKNVDERMALDVLWCLLNSPEAWAALQSERRNHIRNMES
jgi:hypothetical protein